MLQPSTKTPPQRAAAANAFGDESSAVAQSRYKQKR